RFGCDEADRRAAGRRYADGAHPFAVHDPDVVSALAAASAASRAAAYTGPKSGRSISVIRHATNPIYRLFAANVDPSWSASGPAHDDSRDRRLLQYLAGSPD